MKNAFDGRTGGSWKITFDLLRKVVNVVVKGAHSSMDRAVVFETKGSRFESWWAYRVEWRSGYLVRLII